MKLQTAFPFFILKSIFPLTPSLARPFDTLTRVRPLGTNYLVLRFWISWAIVKLLMWLVVLSACYLGPCDKYLGDACVVV